MLLRDSQRSAIVVIDLQHGLLHGPERPYEGDRVFDRAVTLIAAARRSGAPVVFVQHHGPAGSPFEQGAEAWKLVDGLDPQPDDLRIQKMRPSIFFNTGLEQWLRDARIDRLVLAGLKTQYCIDTSCRVGNELGFKIVLAEDAHTTIDGPLSAATIISYHNQLLRGPFAEVVPSAQIAFS